MKKTHGIFLWKIWNSLFYQSFFKNCKNSTNFELPFLKCQNICENFELRTDRVDMESMTFIFIGPQKSSGIFFLKRPPIFPIQNAEHSEKYVKLYVSHRSSRTQKGLKKSLTSLYAQSAPVPIHFIILLCSCVI
jgi:hypothetical protein